VKQLFVYSHVSENGRKYEKGSIACNVYFVPSRDASRNTLLKKKKKKKKKKEKLKILKYRVSFSYT